jgi:hypothetical protein
MLLQLGPCTWKPKSGGSTVGIATVLRAWRPRGRSSGPCKVRNFYFSTSLTPAMWRTQPPIPYLPRDISLGLMRKGREADLYIRSIIYLHGIVLDYLSTATTLPVLAREPNGKDLSIYRRVKVVRWELPAFTLQQVYTCGNTDRTQRKQYWVAPTAGYICKHYKDFFLRIPA